MINIANQNKKRGGGEVESSTVQLLYHFSLDVHVHKE